MSHHICNLVVPGAAKSGTSSLHEALDAHPDISMSKNKEPHFFCCKPLFERGADYHNSLFDRTATFKVYGESSTGYMICEQAIQRISTNLRSPKIIMILRDPVDRTFSHYRWRYKLGLEKRSFLEALRKDGYEFNPEKPHKFGYMSYLQFSKYSVYVPLWINAFGRKNVLLQDSRFFRNNTNLALSQIHRFLGVAPFERRHIAESNSTESLVARPNSAARFAARLLPTRFKKSQLYHKIRYSLLSMMTKEPPRNMSKSERNFIESELANDIAYFHNIFRD